MTSAVASVEALCYCGDQSCGNRSDTVCLVRGASIARALFTGLVAVRTSVVSVSLSGLDTPLPITAAMFTDIDVHAVSIVIDLNSVASHQSA